MLYTTPLTELAVSNKGDIQYFEETSGIVWLHNTNKNDNKWFFIFYSPVN